MGDAVDSRRGAREGTEDPLRDVRLFVREEGAEEDARPPSMAAPLEDLEVAWPTGPTRARAQHRGSWEEAVTFFKWRVHLYRITLQRKYDRPAQVEEKVEEVLAFNEGDVRRLIHHNYPGWQVEKVTPAS